MSEINQINDIINEELEKSVPNPDILLVNLFSLQILTEGVKYAPKDEWRYLSDTEFFKIVGDTFKRKPEFYMDKLYKKVRNRIRNLYGDDRRKEMEKTIVEHYCLYDAEQILLEFDGSIEFYIKARHGVGVGGNFYVNKSKSSFYVTNQRIIAQGPIGYRRNISFIKGSERLNSPEKNIKEGVVNYSRQEKCYGYIFPIRNLSKLKRNRILRGIHYSVDSSMYYEDMNELGSIRILFVPSLKQVEKINKLIEILSKYSK